MQKQIERVEGAINEFKKGKMVILTDNENRENEGDLIIPAELICSDHMNFMIRNGTGIVCLAMSEKALKPLNLPMMVEQEKNTSVRFTPFTVSIDAKDHITTGVSAQDRTETVLKAVSNNVCENDFVKPGHIFPLKAQDGGVLKRQGHTEGSVDLAKIGGFKEAAAICEIMNLDGTMAKGEELEKFARKNALHLLSIDDILFYRQFYEDLIEEEATANIPIEPYGIFKLSVIKEKYTGALHAVFSKEAKSDEPLLVRIHSACITGDLFGSQRCDCHAQLQYSLKRISEEGGKLIYMNQEGRGIGFFNKIKAYALQEQGLDTVEANEKLGLPIDARHYHIAANILRNHLVKSVRLLTNNLQKVQELIDYGISSTIREPIPCFHNHFNQCYLQTKKNKLKHAINFE